MTPYDTTNTKSIEITRQERALLRAIADNNLTASERRRLLPDVIDYDVAIYCRMRRLEIFGLVERRRVPSGRRKLFATDAGKQLLSGKGGAR